MLAFIAASVPGALVANAETELEKAERLAAETQRSRNVAESAYVADQAIASDLEIRLSVTLETYRRVNAELETVGLRLAGERADMDAIRGEVIALDNEAQARAVGAYIRSLAVPGSSMFLSGTFESLSVANETIKRASELDESLFEQLDSRRADLAEHTLELQSGLDELALLNDELAAARIELARAEQKLEAITTIERSIRDPRTPGSAARRALERVHAALVRLVPPWCPWC